MHTSEFVELWKYSFPLQGFVAAVAPFNFTAIGGNLAGTPAMMVSVFVFVLELWFVFSSFLLGTICTFFYFFKKQHSLIDWLIDFLLF